MLHVMLWEGWIDAGFIAAHTQRLRRAEGAGARLHAEGRARSSAASPRPTSCRRRAGSPSPSAPPTLSLYCQGLNQSASGTAKNAALINLHLATGQIGKPGRRPVLADRPAERDGRPRGRRPGQPAVGASRPRRTRRTAPRSRALWGVDDVPARAGQDRGRAVRGRRRGEIKALWIACTNPAQSMPDQATVRARARALRVRRAAGGVRRRPRPARYADLLLPATTWGEKDGTVTNSERRISRVRAAVAAPGEARDDWRSPSTSRAGSSALPARPARPTLFPYDDAEVDLERAPRDRRAAAISTSPA